MTKYVIGWSCGECGSDGEVIGNNVHDAWTKSEPVGEY